MRRRDEILEEETAKALLKVRKSEGIESKSVSLI